MSIQVHPPLPCRAPIAILAGRSGGLTQLHRRRQEDPHARRGQGRLEAVLEIPQRGHPQEIQGEATSRLARQQEGFRASSRREEGDREAAGRERDRGSCPRACSKGTIRGSRAIRRSDSLRRSELVSGCTSFPPFPLLRR